MTDIERKALQDFLLDINCLKKLDKWANQFNVFDMLRITNTEIRHSNVLAWLLDPNENHGAGDAFLREFITLIVKKLDPTRYDPFSLLIQDLNSYQVYREPNHMDIVLVSEEEKTAYIIENKVWASESKHQLKDYYDKSLTEYRDCNKRIYVFLTPNGHAASNPKIWTALSYYEVIEAFDSIAGEMNLEQEVCFVINDYIETVRKNILGIKDKELESICRSIYNKHRTALRLIFENSPVALSADTEIIQEVLQEYRNEGKVILTDKAGADGMFYTEEMDRFLPPLDSENSSWGTNRAYYFWFEKKKDDKKDEESFVIHLELGAWNITDQMKQRIDVVSKVLGKNPAKGDWRYWRIYKSNGVPKQDDYENSLRGVIKKLVEGALDFEKDLLEKANKLV